MQTITPRIEARVPRWLLAGTALVASLAPEALLPECLASAILLPWIESISLERIGSIAALTNALTLMP